MAQSFQIPESWRRGERPAADVPPETQPAVRRIADDELSRYIDGLLSGEQSTGEQVLSRPAQPSDWRSSAIFVAMMTLAIWGLVKIAML